MHHTRARTTSRMLQLINPIYIWLKVIMAFHTQSCHYHYTLYLTQQLHHWIPSRQWFFLYEYTSVLPHTICVWCVSVNYRSGAANSPPSHRRTMFILLSMMWYWKMNSRMKRAFPYNAWSEEAGDAAILRHRGYSRCTSTSCLSNDI